MIEKYLDIVDRLALVGMKLPGKMHNNIVLLVMHAAAAFTAQHNLCLEFAIRLTFKQKILKEMSHHFILSPDVADTLAIADL